MSTGQAHQLSRVRKPRVHITYDVETNGAPVKKELPFVMGVVGDFSGNPTAPPKSLRDRKFNSIDRDNFNDIMKSIKPELNIRVRDVLQGGDKEMPLSLKFNSMGDFEPDQLVDQVPVLKAMRETRNKLRELLTTVDQSNPDLEAKLEQILADTSRLQKMAGELGVSEQKKEGGEA